MKRAAVIACPILSKTKKISSGKGSGNADNELNALTLKEGSEKTKTFRKEDSESLITQDPVNDRPEHFCHFYGKDSPFSNFHPAKFVLDGVLYNCSEQYMMYQKPMLFQDEEVAHKILWATDPLTMKIQGRKVRGFDDNVWTTQCVEIVTRGVKAKFKQNPHLEKALIDTLPRILAEATPRSPLWGIGLDLSDPLINNRNTWRGKNWLGYLLTDVRNLIMEERGMFTSENSKTRGTGANLLKN